MEHIIESAENQLIAFGKRFELVFVDGKDHTLTDINGKKYMDFTSGIAVVNLGHCNKRVNDAVKKQIDKISHISNLFYIPGQAELAKKICEKSFDGKMFFCNSGAEANETALKIVRLAGNKMSPSKNKVLAVEGSFHGRTVGTITLTGQEKYKKGFEPLLPNIEIVDYNSVESLERAFDDNVCAIFIEVVQCEGGVRALSDSFIAKINELAVKHNALIVIDEVQTGIGRTGKAFGYLNFDIKPDIITMAKALGNGFPIGAILVKPEIAGKIPLGFHNSTFGGNYLATAAGCAVLDQITPQLLDKVNSLAAYLKKSLESLKERKGDKIGDIRVYGLMIGVDLNGVDVGSVILSLIEKGIVTLRAGNNTLRLAPPFTITEKEVDILINALDKIL
jgi:predicted acetylornithine/succinylornithine family transaminase